MIGIYNLPEGTLHLKIENPGLICDNVQIDEVGAVVSTLDASQKFVNIWAFEWKYKMDTPAKPIH